MRLELHHERGSRHMSKRPSRGRLGMTLAVAVGAVAAFATVGGVGLAGGLAKPVGAQYGPGQYQYATKVAICHKGRMIRVSINAWPAHQRHADAIGPCAVPVSAKKAAGAKSAKAAKAAKPTRQAKPGKQSTSSGASSTPAVTTTTAPVTSAPSKGKGKGK
jgi:hypothetical protein